MADNGFKINKSANFNPQSGLPANPVDGDFFYDATAQSFAYYHNGSWANFDSVGVVTAALWLTSAQFTAAIVRNSVVKVTGAGALTHLAGISSSFSAKKITIYNAGAYTIVVEPQDAMEATANNRIQTPTGGSMNLVPGEIAVFTYDIVANRWLLVSISSQAGAQIIATISNPGLVTLHQASLLPLDGVVLSDGDLNTANGVVGLNASRAASITPSAGNTTALTLTGLGSGRGLSSTGGVTNGTGVYGKGGGGDATGVYGEAVGEGNGVYGLGGTNIGAGVYGQGTADGAGVIGVGGNSQGIGGSFTGGTGGHGIVGIGTGDAYGGSFTSGDFLNRAAVYAEGGCTTSTSHGVEAHGGPVNGHGVLGFGTGSTGSGVKGSSTGASAIGVEGSNSGGTGIGVQGTGITGVKGISTTGNAVLGTTAFQNGAAIKGTNSDITGLSSRGIEGTGLIGVFGTGTTSIGTGVYGTAGTGLFGIFGDGGTGSGVGVRAAGGATQGIGLTALGGNGVVGGVGLTALGGNASGASSYGATGIQSTGGTGTSYQGFSFIGVGPMQVTNTNNGTGGGAVKIIQNGNDAGLLIQSNSTGFGIDALSDQSNAIFARASSGTNKIAPLRIQAQGTAPLSGTLGDMYVDSSGILWIYNGSAFVKVGTQT